MAWPFNLPSLPSNAQAEQLYTQSVIAVQNRQHSRNKSTASAGTTAAAVVAAADAVALRHTTAPASQAAVVAAADQHSPTQP